jgi:hypothetical protein
MMTLQQIKDAVDAGKTVHWLSSLYTVVRDKNGQYLIRCPLPRPDGHYVGLTQRDGTQRLGEAEDFYIKGTKPWRHLTPA